jgi:Glycosyltransferase (GlcNAc)
MDRRALTFWVSADYPPPEQPLFQAESIKSHAVDDLTASYSTTQTKATKLSPIPHDKVSLLAHVELKSKIATTETKLNHHQKEDCGPSHVKIPSTRIALSVDPHVLPYSLPQHHWDKKTIFVSVASYCDCECGATIRDLFKRASKSLRVYVGVAWQGNMVRDFIGENEWRAGNSDNVIAAASSGCSSSSSSSSSSQAVESEGDWGTALRSNVRTAFIPSHQASGPVWARGVAFSLWRGEDYYLQIDSHMRFRPGWDRYLVWQLERVREEEEMKEVVGEVEAGQEKKQTEGTEESDGLQSDSLLERSARKRRKRKKPVLTTYPLGYELPNVIPDDIRPTLLVTTAHNILHHTHGRSAVLLF